MPQQSKYTKQGYNDGRYDDGDNFLTEHDWKRTGGNYNNTMKYYNTDGGNLFNGRGGSKKRNYKPTRKVRKTRSRTRSRGRMSRRNK